MKIQYVIALLLLIIPVKSFAQLDEREPGIYTVVNGESIPLPFAGDKGFSVGTGGDMGGVSYQMHHYKSASSGVSASDTLILVIDLNKKTGSATPEKINAFTKSTTPEDMIILPLSINYNKDRRESCSFRAIGPKDVKTHLQVKISKYFEWEKISDNSFMIKLPELPVGEYGVFFRLSDISGYIFSGTFGFSVPKQNNAQ